MAAKSNCHLCRAALWPALLLIWLGSRLAVKANPTGGTVTQGQASIVSSGSQLNVNQTSANASINWQTFNIGAGETVNFNQPSASSVTWNYIGDVNPSSINGTINANGWVVLQNPNGFTVAGSAAINTHGLVMTTASTPALNLASGGPWSFDAPPPTAKIVNCGQINITGGGSAYLIASDIENNGTISAPGGNIGLYAGENVLVSTSPDGRGLSTQVTLPQGSVDNEGKLIADAGSIAAQAQTVNQNGLVQANSAQDVNGTIELVAGDAVNLGAKSVISAQGSAQGVSAGGAVTIQSGNTFSDQSGSSINVSGGAQGGNGGQVEISAPTMSGINSSIIGGAVDGFSGGTFDLDPTYLWLASASTDPEALPGYTVVNVNSYSTMGTISLLGEEDIVLNTAWTLAADTSSLIMSALNDITLNSGSSIVSANNATIRLTAGTSATSASQVSPGNDGIYLEGSGTIQSGGNITLSAANEVIFGTDSGGSITAGNGTIETTGSGSIGMTAKYGNIDTGNGFISAVGSGQITLSAGNDITLLAGSEIEASQSGNVNLTAGTQGQVSPGNAGIYLEGNSVIQTASGNITLNAANEVIFGTDNGGLITDGNGTIQTTGGGSISVTAQSGDIDTGNGAIAGLSSGATLNLSAGDDITLDNGSEIQAGAIGLNASTLNLGIGSEILANNLNLAVNSISSASGGISLAASDNIQFSSSLNLADSAVPVTLSLSAGNDITLNNASIQAGSDWSLNLAAGTSATSASQVSPGNDGIYLEGSSLIQTANGSITLNAVNEVIIGTDVGGTITAGIGAIDTTGGGSISVAAQYGSINTGVGTYGFVFPEYESTPPNYTISPDLSGISTEAGGNVTLTAGGNITSFPTTTVATSDPGTGAFGSEAGNVTITAGGNVYGNFTVANGNGIINAGGNIGTSSQNVALSLVDGSWTLNAGWNPATEMVQNGIGNIYLQEVRNPNGIFNNSLIPIGRGKFEPSTGYHYFDYGLEDSVTLNAGDGVDITGANLPRPDDPVPMILPPTLIINAGVGGVTLNPPTVAGAAPNAQAGGFQPGEQNITLFPSPYGNLEISITDGGSLNGNGAYLLMSDSGLSQWVNTIEYPNYYSGPLPFGPSDHAGMPPELDNLTPVTLNISGSINSVTLQLSKFADITVGGNMESASVFGENLQADQATTINVAGQIYFPGSFTFVTLSQALPDILQLSQSLLSAGDTLLPPGYSENWYTLLELAVNTSLINNQSYSGIPQQALSGYIYYLFPGLGTSSVNYNSSTRDLSVAGPLSSTLFSALESPTLTLVVYGPNGYPVLQNGQIQTVTIPWITSADATLISSLYASSQSAPPLGSSGAIIVGGTGELNVTASSVYLGNSDGILAVGEAGTPQNPFLSYVSYSSLGPYINSGASVNVTITGPDPSPTQASLDMPASTIAALSSGDVTVTSEQGSMDLGSQDYADFEGEIMNLSNLGLGIYSTGGGNVNVTANGDINVDTSRIATFNGGNVSVTSQTGNVDAGSGGEVGIPINVFSPLLPTPYEYAFANGIVADSLEPEPNGELVPGAATAPGNITVDAPEGNIEANLGGILQESLGSALPPGVFIDLTAGSTGPPFYLGNIDLGQSGAIGGTINVSATGTVSGLLIAQQGVKINAQNAENLQVFAIGPVDIGLSGPPNQNENITIVSKSIDATGLGTGNNLISQNASVNGGTSQSTMGTSASSTSASQSAAQQATQTAAQQVAGYGTGEDGNQNKKKATVRVGRVTVILSAAVPHRQE